MVVVSHVQTKAGMVVDVREDECPASYDPQTRQRYVLRVVGHDQHVTGYFLNVLQPQVAYCCFVEYRSGPTSYCT